MVLSSLAALGLGGCGDDEGGPLPPTYATFESVVSRSCRFQGSCHGGVMLRRSSAMLNFACPEGGCDPEAIPEGDYRAAVVGVPSTQSNQVYRIAPGDPEASYLWHKIEGTHRGAPMCGTGDPMPRLEDEGLAQNERDAIREWILAGAPAADGTPSPMPPPLPGYPAGCPERDGGT